VLRVDMESLKEENRRLKDTMLCKICMEKDICTLFLPCSHLVCCEDCAPALRDCPVCRTAIRGTVRTYISWMRRSELQFTASECTHLFATSMLFIVTNALCHCWHAVMKAGTGLNWILHTL